MKLNVGRIFDISRVINTKAGAEIKDFIEYVTDTLEQTTRLLRKQITFSDNVQCIQKKVGIYHDVFTPIYTEGKTIQGVLITRTYDRESMIDSFSWFYDDNGIFNLRVKFSNAPTYLVDIDVMLFY